MSKKSCTIKKQIQGGLYDIFKKIANIRSNTTPYVQGSRLVGQPKKIKAIHDKNTIKKLLETHINKNKVDNNSSSFMFYILELASMFLDKPTYKALHDLLNKDHEGSKRTSENEDVVLNDIYKFRNLKLDIESDDYLCWDGSEEAAIHDLTPSLIQTKELLLLNSFITKHNFKGAESVIKGNIKLLRSGDVFYKRMFSKTLFKAHLNTDKVFQRRFREQIKSFLAKAYNIPSLTHLFQSLIYLLYSMKTIHCCNSEKVMTECICCSPLVKEITNHVHESEKEKTKIYCRITGELINENNPGVLLPNDELYSKKGVNSILKDGEVVCPVTGAKFNYEQLVNVFI